MLVDSLLTEHAVEVVALTRQAEIFREENAALWSSRRTLEELVKAGESLTTSLRGQLALQSVIITAQNKALNPPLSLRFLRGTKIALPVLAVGFGLGVALGST